MFWTIWKGILLGLGAAAPIGPVNVEIARRALREGFFAGFLVGCGAVTVDVTFAALVALSVRPALHSPRLTTILTLLGALVLIYLALLCFRSARRQRDDKVFAGDIRHPGRHYLEGLFMNALNPMILAFWFLIVPGQVGHSPHPARDLPLICLGVFLGTFSWVCGFTSLMSCAGKAIGRHLAFIADISGGLILLGFAAAAIWRVLRPHL